jgi:hypothetical protein
VEANQLVDQVRMQRHPRHGFASSRAAVEGRGEVVLHARGSGPDQHDTPAHQRGDGSARHQLPKRDPAEALPPALEVEQHLVAGGVHARIRAEALV